METRHPVKIYIGREYAAICYHCAVQVAWRHQNWNIFETFLHFLEKRPLMIKFSKFCLESLHRDTDRRCCVQNSWKLSDGKSAKACVIYHFFSSLSNCGYCVDRAQSLPWPALNIWLTTFQISSKSVHFWRTLGGRVKTIQNAPQSRIRLIPINRRSIVSRRVNNHHFLQQFI